MSFFQRRSEGTMCKCKTPSPELIWRCSVCKYNSKPSGKLPLEQAKKVDERGQLLMGPCTEALKSMMALLVRATEGSSPPSIDEYRNAQQAAVKSLTAAFGSFFDDDIATLKKQQDQERRHKERKHLVDELLSTEKDYNDDMQTVLEVWMPAVEAGKFFDSKQQSMIFNMIKQIAVLSNEYCKVFSRVAALPEEEQNLGESMLKMVPFLRLYVEQTSGFCNVSDLINETASKNRAFQNMQTKMASNPRVKGLDLLGFLVMPMQRLARYPLLLQSILKCTEETHPDHASLTLALAELRKVLAEVNELSKLRMSVSLFSPLQQTMTWSSRPVDLVLTGALIQCNENASWELRRYKSEHSCVMKGNHLLLTNILVMLMESGSDQKLQEKKMFYPQELEIQPEDHDTPNTIKINVHRIQKQYAEEKKTTIAGRRMGRSFSVTADSPGSQFPISALDAMKKPPKYVLYINCKDFLDVQSWTSHFKDMIDGASPLPASLYPLNPKLRSNGIRRTVNGTRHHLSNSKMQTISLEEAADRLQSTPRNGIGGTNHHHALSGSSESPTRLVVKDPAPVICTTPTASPLRTTKAAYTGVLSSSSPPSTTPTSSSTAAALLSPTHSLACFVPQSPVTPAATGGIPPSGTPPAASTPPNLTPRTNAAPSVTIPTANVSSGPACETPTSSHSIA